MYDVMQADSTSANFYGHRFPSFQADFTPSKRGKLSIFPKDDLLAKAIESWRAFSDSLREEDRETFHKMIRQSYKHIKAINVKGEPYTTESLMMSLILTQQQMIEFVLKNRK